ncbi:MAG: HAMP domain-containing histidine kinase [Deltaproteobacteria bacterium]|nr:HAMP domain-containing histidine kinase [Deltaproteobacteria bacterium]
MGFGVIYALMAVVVAYAVEQADRQIINAKLEEYRVRFEHPAFRDPWATISPSMLRIEDEPFLVRLSDANNRTLFSHVPRSGIMFDDASMEVVAGAHDRSWTRLRANDDRTWTIGGVVLSAGRYLQIGMSSAHSDVIVRWLKDAVVFSFPPLLLLGLLGSGYLTRRALLPIRDLSRTMRAIEASGDLAARVPERTTADRTTGDDLDDLSRLFNRLVAKQERLVTAMRESLDNVAHDLRTPLTRLRGVAELALTEDRDGQTMRETLADCLEEADRLTSMLATLMDISEAESGVMKLERTRFELGAVAEEVTELYHYVAEGKGVSVSIATPSATNIAVRADRTRLFRAVANLVDNAIKYTPSGGAVTLKVRQVGAMAEIEVSDEGPGIDVEDLPRIWERLYRADKSRTAQGLGLGLSFVRAIVMAHGGTIEAISKPGQGARFVIRIPPA